MATGALARQDGHADPVAPFTAPPDLAARAANENFSVAPRLLPRAWRDDLLTLYGYARLVDWIGDEYTGDRDAALDWVSAALERTADDAGTDDILTHTRELIARRHVSPQPFHDLVAANRRDQLVHDYASFDELIGYCRLSANPVGRVVLAVLDAATPARIDWSDDVCTALQLVEHWQDVGEDARAGRVYLPGDDRRTFGVGRDELSGDHASPALRALMRFEVARARALLDAPGVALCAALTGRARLLVAGFVGGGHAALDAIERADGDVLGVRCRPRPVTTTRHTARVLWLATGWGRRR